MFLSLTKRRQNRGFERLLPRWAKLAGKVHVDSLCRGWSLSSRCTRVSRCGIRILAPQANLISHLSLLLSQNPLSNLHWYVMALNLAKV